MRSFSEIHWLDFPKTYFETIRQEILSNGKDYILKVDEDEYVKYLVEKYTIESLSVLTESEHISEPTKSTEMVYDMFGREVSATVLYFTITYNFTGHAGLFKVKPNPSGLVSHEINVNTHNSTVSFNVKLLNQNPEEFKQLKARSYSDAFFNIKNLNTNVEEMNRTFEQDVRNVFITEKNKYKKENDFYAAINVKVNPNTTSVFTAPTIKKRIIPQPDVPKGKELNSVPTMSSEMYNDVLKVIYDSGKGMEKKPSLYQNKDEEGLRDQFLFILETRYVGTTATGETFNKGGKTDIILKYANDGTNLFIAECKFWHGSSEYLKAITQLFDRYLTWRDSKVAVILFVQNQSFSDVLETIQKDTSTHPYYTKDIGKRGESSFSYLFHLPQDKNKPVEVEIMAFHYHQK